MNRAIQATTGSPSASPLTATLIVALLVMAPMAVLLTALPAAATHTDANLHPAMTISPTGVTIGAGSIFSRDITVSNPQNALPDDSGGDAYNLVEFRVNTGDRTATFSAADSGATGWAASADNTGAGGRNVLSFTGSTIPAGSSQTFTVALQTSGVFSDGDTLDVQVRSQHAGGRINTATLTVTLDVDPPAVDAAVARDLNADGAYDAIEITFSESILDSSVAVADFMVNGAPPTGSSTGDAANDAVIIVSFPDVRGTDAIPDITYTPGTLTDVYGNALAALASDGVTETDGAGPVPVVASGAVDSAQVLVVLHEASATALDANSFTYNGGAAGDGITSVSHTAGDAMATVELDAAITAAGLGADTLGIVEGAAEDEHGNPGPAVTLTIDSPKATDLTGSIGSKVATMVFNGPVENADGRGLNETSFTVHQVPGGTVTSIVSVSHQAGDSEALITFDDKVSPTDAGVGGGSVLAVEILADEAFAPGGGGIVVPATSLDLVDTTAPSIERVTTRGDGSGSIDALEVLLTEFFDKSVNGAFDATLWNIDGVGAPDSVTAAPLGASTPVGNIDRLYLNFDGVAAGFDTASTPTVTYTGTALVDLLGNVMADEADVASIDGAPPVVESLATEDRDGDGQVDAVGVVFSEPIDDSTLDADEFSVEDDGNTWTVSTQLASGFTTDVENDTYVSVKIPESGLSDTAIRPILHYTPAATLKDLAGVPAEAFQLRVDDGVAPIITKILATPGSSGGMVLFSEPVELAIGGDLTSDALAFINVNSGGATAISGVSHNAATDGARALLDFNAPVASGDINRDTVGAVVAKIVGQSDGLPVAPLMVKLTNPDAPAISAAKTLDRDGNGYIDAIEVTFDRAIRDSFAGASTLRAADWTLAAPYGDADGHPSSVVTSLTGAAGDTDDATIFLILAEETTEKPDGDTAERPAINYLAGRIVDHNGHPLGQVTSQAVTDGALPRLMRVQGNPGSTQAELFFSEGVRGTGSNNALTVANLQYLNRNGVAAGSIASITHSSGDRTATITLNRALSATGADHGLGGSVSDTIQPRTTVTETSAAGGKAVVGGVAVEITDTQAPEIESIVTRDDPGAPDGRIDQLIVTFTEPIEDGALDLDQWTIQAPYGDANDHPISIETGAVADDAVIILRLAPISSGTDTEVTPDVSFAATAGIADLLGNLLEDFSDREATDGAAPVVMGMQTRDLDDDGRIDAILVEFSENVADSSFDPDDWVVADTSGFWATAQPAIGAQVGDDGAVNDAFILVPFAESSRFDTSLAPDVTHAAGGSLTDSAGNVVGALQMTASDGAPAVIGALGGTPGSATVEVRFSEAVRARDGGALGVASFTFVNSASGGATGIDGVSHVEGDDFAILTLDALLNAADFDEDRIGAAPNAVQEYRSGTCGPAVDCLISPDTEVSFVDLNGPVVVEAITLDVDANGRIDAIRVTFDEAIQDGVGNANLVAADWKIVRAGGDVAAISVLTQHPNFLAGADDVDDDTIFITFAEAASGYDTASTPSVRYTPGSAGRVIDHDGHIFGGRTFATTDGAMPIVVGAKTLDVDGDGLIDGYAVTASEALEDGSLDDVLWSVAGATVTNVDTGATADDDVVRVLFDELSALHTGSLPDLSYLGGDGVTDLVGNNLHAVSAGAAAAGGLDEADGAAPVIVKAVTQDVDEDGYLDHVIVTFSEAIDDGGAATLDKSEWGLPASLADARGRPLAIGTGSAAGDDKIQLDFVDPVADAAHNTGFLPTITYTPTATIADAAGNKMLAASHQAIDGAKPIISKMATLDRDDDGLIDGIQVTFSEDIDDRTEGIPHLVPSQWTLAAPYGDANNQPTGVQTTLTTGSVDDALVYLLFDEVGTAGTNFDTAATPAVSLSAATTLKDLSGNGVGGALTHTPKDQVAPRLLTATTADLNGNGLIDGYELEFSEAIDDSTFKPGEWAVEGTSVDDFLTGASVDDAQITVTFVESSVLDTGAKPQLTYTPTATLTDLAGNGLRAIGTAAITEIDGVAPQFLRAVSSGLQSQHVDLEFSEPIQPVGASFALTDFVYTDVSGDGASGLTSITPHTSGRKLSVSLNGPFAESDNEKDTIGVLADKIKDAADNRVAATTHPVKADLTPPSQITDLAVKADTLARRALTLQWTTPSAPDVASFELRQSTSEITSTTFGSATVVAGLPAPTPGAMQELQLTGLTPNTKYHFAMKTTDRVGNVAQMSNVLAVTTVADTVAPGKITDLGVKTGSVVGNGAVLTWTAPGDDAFESDPADRYDIRISQTEITAANFAQATAVTPPPAPQTGGTSQEFSLTGLTTETKYWVALRAIDQVENTGEVSNVISFTTTKDSTPPAGQPVVSSSTHTSGVPSTTKVPVVSWTAVSDPDSAVVYRYKLSTQATYTVTATDTETTQTTVTLPSQEDGTYYFHVAAMSDGGASQAAPFQIIIDTVAPGAVTVQSPAADDITATTVTLRWGATGNNGNTGTATAYELRYSSAAITASNFASATAVNGLPAPKASGQAEAFTVTGLAPKTTYHFALRVLDGAGNAGPVSSSVSAVTKEDTTPPTGTLTITSETHGAGFISTLRSGTFKWSGVSDPETSLRFHYAVNTQEDYTVVATDEQTTATEVTLDSLANGRRYLHVRAASDGGLGPQDTYAFSVLALTSQDLAKLREEVQLTVERVEGGNRIKWVLPDDLPAAVKGLQVWYSNSPYQLLKTLQDTDPEFTSAALLHTGEQAKVSTQYIVTLFFGDSEELGKFSDANNTVVFPSGLKGDTVVVDESGFPTWGWILIGLGALAVVALLVALIVVARRRDQDAMEEDDPVAYRWGADEWDQSEWSDEGAADDVEAEVENVPPTHEPYVTASGNGMAMAMLPVHDVECPSCAADFAVEGERPLTTTCPSCGVRGVLS